MRLIPAQTATGCSLQNTTEGGDQSDERSIRHYLPPLRRRASPCRAVMKITYWSDYACPYCYIGEARLEKALESLGPDADVEVRMKAFQLYPDAPTEPAGTTTERFAAKYGLTRAQAAQQIEQISQLGRAEGLEFNYSTTQNSNTMDAHRLTKLAQRLGNPEFEKLCFEAYFGNNLVLADHEVLRDLAAQAGLPSADVERVLASDEFLAEVLEDEQEAARRGVHGVPYFDLDGEISIPGAAPTSEMEKALRALLDRTAVSGPAGAACGPDGCALVQP